MQYLKQSFNLVYWVFCKPLSFKQKYDALTAQNDNIKTRFKYTIQALANSLLAIITFNVFLISVIGCLYSFLSVESFDWFAAAFGVAGGRVYLWLPELLWVLVLYIRQILSQASPSPFLLPFYYDERILLPLPFLKTWLIQAYENKPAATLQTLDYLTNSTNQQELAAQARIGIVVNRLNSCQNFSDLTYIYQEFSWLPNPLPSEFNTAIPELLEISQDTHAAEQASSPYRTFELLNRPIQRLKNLQNTLSFTRSPHTPTLGQTTQRWLSILTTAQDNYQEQFRDQAEIPQAYIAGNALSPDDAKERFKGRQDIFQAIETFSLNETPPVLLLYGGRRTGKTSSLKYLPRMVNSSLIPLLVDLQGTAISSQMTSFAKTFAGQIQNFARENHGLSISSPPQKDIEEDPFPTLLQWLTEIESLAPHKRFILCLDEFERLSQVINSTNNEAPLNFLRTLMQNHKRWILLFSGSHTLEELEPYWSDTLINAQSLRMTYLKQNEAQELIRNPVTDFPDIYTEEAVERLLYWTTCQPYLLQLFGTVIVDQFNQRSEPLKQRVTIQDIDDLVPKVLERGKAYFNEFWRRTINHEQQKILAQLILQKHLNEIPKNQISVLIHKEIICKTNNHYQFQVPLIELYCRQQIE